MEQVPDPALKKWVHRLEAGESLFEEGDVDKRVFILIDGKVEVLRGSTRVAEIDVGDTFIGEISGLTGQPRSATVKTLRASTFLAIDAVEELFQANSAWGLKLAKVLARRLVRMNDMLGMFQQQLEAERRRSSRDEVASLLATVAEALKVAGQTS